MPTELPTTEHSQPNPAGPPGVAVAICAFTERRWPQILEAAQATRRQLSAGDRLILVIDHNEDLLQRARHTFLGGQTAAGPPGRPGDQAGPVVVLANRDKRGLAGGRNTAVEAAGDAEVVVFLDDDAVPRAGWLAALRARFAGEESTIAVGGAVEARWAAGRPAWFPAELGWMVGCDYPGMAGHGATIRNPIGANMAVRRTAFEQAGGFHTSMGRIGSKPVGCEETELAIRIRQRLPQARIVRDTDAVVDHLVPAERAHPSYLWRRGWHEGRSKAALTRLVGTELALASEKGYLLTSLRAVGRHLAAVRPGDASGLTRASVLVMGVAGTGLGYLTGRLRRISSL